MKHNKLNPDLPLELTIMPDYQSQPFTISGNFESVMPLAEAVQEADKAIPATRTRKAGNKLIQAVRSSGDTLLGRISMDIETKVFDIRMGTNLYEQLVQKRKDEKIVKQGVKIGLISLTDTVCVKHAHAVDQLRG